eukprot:6895734-Pyramimonas_sp.AAC.1
MAGGFSHNALPPALRAARPCEKIPHARAARAPRALKLKALLHDNLVNEARGLLHDDLRRRVLPGPNHAA